MATEQMIQLATLADFIRSHKNAILTVMREMLFCTCICNTHYCKQGVSNLLALASHSQLSNDHLSRIDSEQDKQELSEHMCINFEDIQSYTCIYFRHTITQKCLSQFSDKGCLEITLFHHTLQ